MTPGCNKVQHPQAQSYHPKGVNASNPFMSRQNKGSNPLTHSGVASKFYGTPSVKASFKIGKY